MTPIPSRRSLRPCLREGFINSITNDPLYQTYKIEKNRPLEVQLSSLLSHILKTPPILLGLAARSHFHDNGFVKFRIATTPAASVRVHVWTKQTALRASVPENIHNHRWDFISWIVLGAFRAEFFVLDVTASTVLPRYEYEPRKEKHFYRMARKPSESLRPVLTMEYARDVIYFLHSSQLHRITPITSSICCTLIVRFHSKHSQPSIFSEQPLRSSSVIPSPSLTAQYTQRILRRILQAVRR